MSMELGCVTKDLFNLTITPHENKNSESVKTKVTISEWDPKNDSPIDQEEIRHLDIGSANYDSSTDRGELYQPTTSDKAGEIIHRVLFCNINNIIKTNLKCKKFSFYLLDRASKGLDQAAENLANHVRKTFADKALVVRIVKITDDFFKMRRFPKVDSSSFIYPPDYYFPRFFFPQDKPGKTKKALKLFTKLVENSRQGLLVKEICMPSIQIQLCSHYLILNPATNGLSFEPADTTFLPNYTLPSGKEHTLPGLSYRVTKEKTEEKEQNLRSLSTSKEVTNDYQSSASTTTDISDILSSSTSSTGTPS